MAVYVDKSRNLYRGMIMCHMMADTVEELHEMADKIGLQRKWFQPKSTPHYDVSLTKRSLALSYGALEIDRKKMVEIIWKYRREKIVYTK